MLTRVCQIKLTCCLIFFFRFDIHAIVMFDPKRCLLCKLNSVSNKQFMKVHKSVCFVREILVSWMHRRVATPL